MRGVDYEGQFSQFPGELYMLHVFVERFCRLCDEIFTVLTTKVFMVSIYIQVISEI